MANAPSNDQLVSATGPEKSEPEAICAYDRAHGEYKVNVDPQRVTAQRPAKDTKSPFRLGSK